MASNGQKQYKSPLFARRAKKALAEDQSPPQELELGPLSGPYLLVVIKNAYSYKNIVLEVASMYLCVFGLVYQYRLCQVNEVRYFVKKL